MSFILTMEKWENVILFIGENSNKKVYATNISYNLRINYNYVLEILRELEVKKIIQIDYRSKTKYIMLTNKGIELNNFLALKKELIK